MGVYLMQHGQATTEAEDPERPPTAAGRATAQLLAREVGTERRASRRAQVLRRTTRRHRSRSGSEPRPSNRDELNQIAETDADGPINDELDGAYRSKYRRYTGPVTCITGPPARSTTLKPGPRQEN